MDQSAIELNLEASLEASPGQANTAPAEATTEAVAEAEETAEVSGFSRFGLPENLINALARCGYQEPSPIQAAAIPELMLGRDLLGQAQTGTGKTAAFALPLLARIDLQERLPQVLVLAPNHRLPIERKAEA